MDNLGEIVTQNRREFRATARYPLAAFAVCLAFAAPVAAITVKIDYTYDTSNFFGNGNPQGLAAGAQAKGALEAAAAFYNQILADAFSPITIPAPYSSSVSDGLIAWQWTRTFSNPSTGNLVTLTHTAPGATIANSDYVVFAGARNLASAGTSGPGGFSWRSTASGSFSFSEITQINSITSTFQNQVEHRGQSSGFADWGGSVAFDSVPPAPWHFDHTAPVSAGTLDFYTVAVHELAHALGFGACSEWDASVSGSLFSGPEAKASYGGSPVPLADAGHWSTSVMSTVYGGTDVQQNLLSPGVANGTRRFFTELDAAGMKDIGWTVIPLPVPEPASQILLASGFLSLLARRGKSHQVV